MREYAALYYSLTLQWHGWLLLQSFTATKKQCHVITNKAEGKNMRKPKQMEKKKTREWKAKPLIVIQICLCVSVTHRPLWINSIRAVISASTCSLLSFWAEYSVYSTITKKHYGERDDFLPRCKQEGAAVHWVACHMTRKWNTHTHTLWPQSMKQVLISLQSEHCFTFYHRRLETSFSKLAP